MIKYSGAKPVPLILKEEDNFEINIENLESLINEKTRLIILNKKDVEPVTLIYESLAILIIALAILILRVRHLNFFKRD